MPTFEDRVHVSFCQEIFSEGIIIIIIINSNWVITRWQWVFYTYSNMKKKVTRKFKSGGLHEKHVVATWKLGNHLSIRLKTQGNPEKPVSRWPVAGPSGY